MTIFLNLITFLFIVIGLLGLIITSDKYKNDIKERVYARFNEDGYNIVNRKTQINRLLNDWIAKAQRYSFIIFILGIGLIVARLFS